MKRWSGAILSVIASAHLFAQDEVPLPSDNAALPLEIEPPTLIPARAADGSIPDIAKGAAAVAAPDVAKLELDLARAQKRAAAGDRLYRAGIIAKMEAEQRSLKAVQLEAALAEARLQAAKATVEQAVEPDAGTALQEAAEIAKRTALEKHRAEIEQALRNLERQQKLLALGSGRKADVHRAEEKLAELQRAEN